MAIPNWAKSAGVMQAACPGAGVVHPIFPPDEVAPNSVWKMLFALVTTAGLRLKVVNTCAICRKQVTPLEAHVDKSLTWLPLESTTPKVCATSAIWP